MNITDKDIKNYVSNPAKIFEDPRGKLILEHAVGILRQKVRQSASTVRLPWLRDRLPKHVRQDILGQSYALMDQIGRMTLVLILFDDEGRRVIPAETLDQFKGIFAALYEEGVKAEDSLRKLCITAAEAYGGDTVRSMHNTRRVDFDF